MSWVYTDLKRDRAQQCGGDFAGDWWGQFLSLLVYGAKYFLLPKDGVFEGHGGGICKARIRLIHSSRAILNLLEKDFLDKQYLSVFSILVSLFLYKKRVEVKSSEFLKVDSVVFEAFEQLSKSGLMI